MALFVTVSCGERAGLSRPICAISDQELVAEMLRPLGNLLEESDPFNTRDDAAPVPLRSGPARREGDRANRPLPGAR